MTDPAPPSICPFVAGPLQIWVDTGASNALEFLGWTAEGVTITERRLTAPVEADEFGGSKGVPVDYQLFGQQHVITAELAKFQPDVLAKLTRGYNPNVAPGNIGVGMLLVCSAATFRVLLFGRSFVRNYLQTVIEEPIEQSPIGAHYTKARVVFTADPDGDVMYNEVIT